MNNSLILLRPSGKKASVSKPHPLGIYLPLEPPPLGIPLPSIGGGGVGYGYFLELPNKSKYSVMFHLLFSYFTYLFMYISDYSILDVQW